jgi:small-conductance mechanosensitive channel
MRKTRSFFLAAIALYASSQVLSLPVAASRLIQAVLVVGVVLQLALWGNAIISSLLATAISRRLGEDAAAATSLSALGFVARLVLWSVLFLLALDNLGVNITGLVAGLGIGGIAVALAIQSILGDLFASLSIVLDKPFVIGDFIIVDEMLGTVEHIGLKTTRIRSLSGEQIVFSNADLLRSRIRNYKRMYERRVVFSIGVTYQTPYEKLSAIGAMLKEAVEKQQEVRFDRAHFKEYADSSLNFEVVYFVKNPDYNRYMDIQQEINLEIFRRFAEEGIEFAYPTRTLFVQKSAEVSMAGNTNPMN